MKCRRHALEDGSGGVCASCLRERLLVLVTDRAENSLHLHSRSRSESHAHPNSEPAPPTPPAALAAEPFPLPRPLSSDINSVSDTSTVPASSAAYRMPQHFSDPQAVNNGSTSVSVDRQTSVHKKFSIVSTIFGQSRSRDHDPVAPKSSLTPGSWLSAILKAGKKKKKSKEVARLYSADDATAAVEGQSREKKFRKNSQGISHDRGLSAPESGYVTESPLSWRKFSPSPVRRAEPEKKHFGRALAGFAICFSPLAISSSIRRKCQVAEGLAGENFKSASPHFRCHEFGDGGSSAFGPSCSRKMANSGKLR